MKERPLLRCASAAIAWAVYPGFLAGSGGAWGQCGPNEVAKIEARVPAAGDEFGLSVGLSGETAVVGAPGSGALGEASGFACVLLRNQGGRDDWGEVAQLIAADGAAQHRFGSSVAVSGGTAIIGAPGADGQGENSGAAYIFDRSGGGGAQEWSQVRKLTGADAFTGDQFGASVAIGGDLAVVGAPGNGGAGAAYVFARNEGGESNWGQIAKLEAADGVAGDALGVSVAISAETVLAGAALHDAVAEDAGAAYVFVRNAGGENDWTEVAKLTADNGAAGDEFGFATAIAGDTALVGAPFADNGSADTGSAYVFLRGRGGENAWGQVARLAASDASAGDEFGIDVAVGEEIALVGAHADDVSGADSGSAYAYLRDQGGRDNWGQAVKLTALDADAEDRFGRAVAVSGDLAVVGAWGDRDAGEGTGAAYAFRGLSAFTSRQTKLSSADGAQVDEFGGSVAVDGDHLLIGVLRDDDAGTDSGSAWMYTRAGPGTDWMVLKKLVADDAAPGDSFSQSVALSGDLAVVGAFRDNDACEEDPECNSGAVYLFERNAGGADHWGQVRKIVAPDMAPGDEFGISVGASGDRVVVGAYLDDDGAENAGAAYVFGRNEGGPDNWGLIVKLVADVPGPFDWFGFSVAIGGDVVVVGAFLDDDAGFDAGAAYVFERDAGGPDQWGQVAKLTASDASDFDSFGFSVAVDGPNAIVGAANADSGGASSGSAYIFERDRGGPDAWGQAAQLIAADAAPGDFFGFSVSISGELAVAGAYFDDDGGSASGSAYVFARTAGEENWGQVAKLTADDAVLDDNFGRAAAIDGETAAIGAPFGDGAGVDTGSVYIFDLPDCNANGAPDACDIAGGTSGDCNGNGVPDECESDCNENGVADECDIAFGTSRDCNGNGMPDECEGNLCLLADIDCSGDTGFADLLAVLAAWGPCSGCPPDINRDGEVDFADLLVVLSAWGPCS